MVGMDRSRFGNRRPDAQEDQVRQQAQYRRQQQSGLQEQLAVVVRFGQGGRHPQRGGFIVHGTQAVCCGSFADVGDGVHSIHMEAGDMRRSEMAVQERPEGQQSDQDGYHPAVQRMESREGLHISIIGSATGADLIWIKPAPAG